MICARCHSPHPSQRKLCRECLITHRLLHSPPLARLVEQRGPEVLLGSLSDPAAAEAMKKFPKSVNWIEVVSNWHRPWPAAA
jgi:hypothetical protein